MFLVNSRYPLLSSANFGSRSESSHLELAHLLPKLRCQFAEFLLLSSLKRLRIFILPTCVRLRYGQPCNLMLRGFSWERGISSFRLLEEAWSRASRLNDPPDLPKGSLYTLHRDFQHPACLTFSVPSIALHDRFWTINQIPISYGFRPHLRGRLTLRR